MISILFFVHVDDVQGEDSQVLNIRLNPGEELKTEPGAMMYMGDDVEASCECCDTCAGPFLRSLSGEAPCKIVYKNNGADASVVGLTPNFPAKVFALNLGDKHFMVKPGGYMAEVDGVDVSVTYPGLSACCCAGLGCCVQTLHNGPGNSAGTAFVAAGGTVLTRELKAGEKIVVDSSSLVAWSNDVNIGYKPVGSLLACCFSGEGCCFVTAEGPGTVIMQSMSFEKLQAAMGPTKAEIAAEIALEVGAAAAENGGGGAPEGVAMER